MTSQWNPAPYRRRRPRRVWTKTEQMGYDKPRCTVASMRALGCEPLRLPEFAADVVHQMRTQGFMLTSIDIPRPVSYEDADYRWRYRGGTTLGQFVAAHPTGSYLLFTPGHAMALVDGTLTDTARGTGRRRMDMAYAVAAPARTDLANPAGQAAREARKAKGAGGRKRLHALTDSQLAAECLGLRRQFPTASRNTLMEYACWVREVSMTRTRWAEAWEATDPDVA